MPDATPRIELLYPTDSYLQRFEARVLAADADERAVLLDRTAFFPGGGGQPPDAGTLLLGDCFRLPVLRAGHRDGLVWHWLDGPAPEPGTDVTGQLDWQRRYRLMRTHTSLHILSAVVWLGWGASVTGGNMEPLRGRLDFELEGMTRELVAEIEARANAEIAAARPVRVQILPRAEAEQIPDLIRTKVNLLPAGLTEIRTVEIVGLDLQADGGTHVARSDEVGRLRITGYKSKGRLNKRIEIELDDAPVPAT